MIMKTKEEEPFDLGSDNIQILIGLFPFLYLHKIYEITDNERRIMYLFKPTPESDMLEKLF